MRDLHSFENEIEAIVKINKSHMPEVEAAVYRNLENVRIRANGMKVTGYGDTSGLIDTSALD